MRPVESSGHEASVRKTIVSLLGIQTRRLAALKCFPGPHWEDNFSTIFGLDLDGGKAWRSRLPGALLGGHEQRVEGTNCFWMIFGLDVGLRLHQGLVDACLGFGAAACRESGLMVRVRKTIVFSSPQRLPGLALGGQFLGNFWSRIRWWKGVAKQIAGSLAGRVRAWCGGSEMFLNDFWSGRRACWRLHHDLF